MKKLCQFIIALPVLFTLLLAVVFIGIGFYEGGALVRPFMGAER